VRVWLRVVHLVFRQGGPTPPPQRASRLREAHAWPSFDAPEVGQNGVLDLYATKLVSICAHSYAKCIYLDVAFCRYWGNSAACGVGRVADVGELEATKVTFRGVKQ
jgi:hypothetical protein